MRAAWKKIGYWMRTPWADLTGRERDLLNRCAKLIALPLALAVAIPLFVTVGLAIHDSQARSSQNRALIQRLDREEQQLKKVVDEQSKARTENRKRFVQSDLLLCQRVEVVRRQIRKSVKFNEHDTELTLRALGIDPVSSVGRELIARSKMQADQLERRFKPKKCKALPSAQANEPKP